MTKSELFLGCKHGSTHADIQCKNHINKKKVLKKYTILSKHARKAFDKTFVVKKKQKKQQNRDGGNIPQKGKCHI